MRHGAGRVRRDRQLLVRPELKLHSDVPRLLLLVRCGVPEPVRNAVHRLRLLRHRHLDLLSNLVHGASVERLHGWA